MNEENPGPHPQHVGRQFNDLMKNLVKSTDDPVVNNARTHSPSLSAEHYYNDLNSISERGLQDQTLEAHGLATPADAVYYAKHARKDHYGQTLAPEVGGDNVNFTDPDTGEHIMEYTLTEGKHSGPYDDLDMTPRDEEMQHNRTDWN
jgi:hypothetical protein